MQLNVQERIQLRDTLLALFLRAKLIIRKQDNTYRVTRRNALAKIVKQDIELNEVYTRYLSEFKSEEEALYCITHQDDYSNHRCIVCGKVCPFYTNSHGYRAHYLQTCGSISCIETLANSKDARKKCNQTCQAKWNCDWPMQALDTKAKMKESCQKKYGSDVTNPFQAEECKAKMKQTSLKHYGVDSARKDKAVVQQALKVFKKTIIARNNQGKPIRNEDIIEILQTIDSNMTLEKVYSDCNNFKQFILLLFQKKDRLLCISEIMRIFSIKSHSSILKTINQLGLRMYFKLKTSKLEDQFKCFLKDHEIAYKEHNRIFYNNDTKGRLELDFILPDYNIAIELNDLASHNITQRQASYHLHKSQLAQSKGIRLIHIWEWELTDDTLWKRLSRWLLNELDQAKKDIDSNQCTIMIVSASEQKEFLEQYSLEGYIEAEIAYGMYFQNKLISLAAFKKLDDSANQYKLIRLATRYGYTVDLQILLKQFIDEYCPSSIVSKCVLDKYTGENLERLSFELMESIEPNITAYNFQLQRTRFYNAGDTVLNKLHSVYNCGYKIFALSI